VSNQRVLQVELSGQPPGLVKRQRLTTPGPVVSDRYPVDNSLFLGLRIHDVFGKVNGKRSDCDPFGDLKDHTEKQIGRPQKPGGSSNKPQFVGSCKPFVPTIWRVYLDFMRYEWA
jgi:hypothetical protein